MTETKLYIFMGPPGAGKGTLSKLCVDQLGWTQLSTGFLCREHIAQETFIGKKIDFAIKSGKLISDSIILDMVDNWLTESVGVVREVILDGFPRTFEQAKAFDLIINERHPNCSLSIVRFVISDDAVIDRIKKRSICTNSKCQVVFSLDDNSKHAPKNSGVCDYCSSDLMRRSDDDIETVRNRLKIYHEHEKKMLDYYKAVNKDVTEVSVEKPLDSIFGEFKQLILHQ